MQFQYYIGFPGDEEYLPRRVVLARDLTGENLVAYFGLKNTIDASGKVTYPPFLAAETGDGCSEWLATR
ncbi:hypothetical protein LshimejAT787_1100260 [Lyophyllum shimeji]|uniref:Uncharacterized protein n=1 Tax=Lyophyllum shimeji TaxID=47721 RepID=A0A9P3UTC6_LYOSH|nr:hypothetical protein LshimejAT787_1100260 [Lyophyllum shimeji]